MKKTAFTFVVALFVICLPHSLFSQSLDWQIQFLRGQNRESTPINRAIRMKNGDAFIISINADADCFCYVICYDSEQQIDVLHNQAIKAGSEVPLGPMYLTEPSGTETIYVILSFPRQEELERLISLYANSPSRQNTSDLHREIVKLQNDASDLGEPASKIIPSGGTSRGVEEGQGFATQFTGKEKYVRAISISH